MKISLFFILVFILASSFAAFPNGLCKTAIVTSVPIAPGPICSNGGEMITITCFNTSVSYPACYTNSSSVNVTIDASQVIYMPAVPSDFSNLVNTTVDVALDLLGARRVIAGNLISVSSNVDAPVVAFTGSLTTVGVGFSLVDDGPALELRGLDSGSGIFLSQIGNDIMVESDIVFATAGIGGASFIDAFTTYSLTLRELFVAGALSLAINGSGIYLYVPPSLASYTISSTVDGDSIISSFTASSTTLKSFVNSSSVQFSATTSAISASAIVSASDATSGYASALAGCTGANCVFRQFRGADQSIIEVSQDATTIIVTSHLRAQNLPYPNISVALFPDCPFATTQGEVNVCLAARTVASQSNVTNAANVFYTPATPFRGQNNFSVATAFDILFEDTRPVFTRTWYVDALNGDDALGDGSPVNPYRTIGATFAAIGSFPSNQAQEVFLALGTYNESALEWPPNTYIEAQNLLRSVRIYVSGSITLRADWGTVGPEVRGGFSNIILYASSIYLDFAGLLGAPASGSFAKFAIVNCVLNVPYTAYGRGEVDLFRFFLNIINEPVTVNCADVHMDRNVVDADLIISDNACSMTSMEWHVLFNYFEGYSNTTVSQSTSSGIVADFYLNGWEHGTLSVYAAANNSLFFNTFTIPVHIYIQDTVNAHYSLNLAGSQMCELDISYWGASCLNGDEMMILLATRAKTLNDAGIGTSLIGSSTVTTNTLRSMVDTPSLTWGANGTALYGTINFAVTSSGTGGTSIIASTTGQTLVTKELFASGASSLVNNATGIYIITPPGLYTFTDHSLGTAFSWIVFQNATDTYFRGPIAGNSALVLSADGNDIIFTPALLLTSVGAGISLVNSGNATSHVLKSIVASSNIVVTDSFTSISIATSATPTFTSATLSATTNQLTLGTTNTVTLTSPAPAANRTYTIPDTGANSAFVMTDGTQTINGAKTFTSTVTAPTASLTSTTNQLVLGTTNTVTITSPTPAASRTYTIPDTGANSAFVMTDGAQTINGVKTFTSKPILSANVGAQFNNAGNTASVTLATQAGLASSITLNLPTTVGNANDVLTGDGTGNLNFALPSVKTLFSNTATLTQTNPGAGVFVTMLPTGTVSLTIPANTLIAGSKIAFSFRGAVSTNGVSTFSIRVRLDGATTYGTSTSSKGVILTSIPFSCDGYLSIFTSGAGGTALSSGYFFAFTSTTNAVAGFTSTATVAIDTTVAHTFDVQFAFSAANAANVLVVLGATVQHIKPYA